MKSNQDCNPNGIFKRNEAKNTVNISHIEGKQILVDELEQLIESEIIIDKIKLAKKVLFACESCNGPLVQYSMCRICKKTSTRVCLNCNLYRIDGHHESCLQLILLDRIQNTGQSKKEVTA